jgi:hypothetical protein
MTPFVIPLSWRCDLRTHAGSTLRRIIVIEPQQLPQQPRVREVAVARSG